MAEDSLKLPDDEYFEGIRVCHRMIQVNGIALHIAEAGSGSLLVLLHGFPENGRAWVRQFPILVKSGYRVVAPDLRGYGLSDKPTGLHAYRLDVLSKDIRELILALGASAASIVGHDWGGVVAWNLAISYPAVVLKLIVINAPHPSRYIELLWRSRQFFKSWYVFFFLCPLLPEAIIRRNGFERVRVLFRNDPARQDAFTSVQVDGYIRGFSEPSALTAAINYYRAGICYGLSIIRNRSNTVASPTLLIWGELDRYLDIRLAENLGEWVPQLVIRRIKDASHWVVAEQPELVSHLIIDFLEPRDCSRSGDAELA